MPDYVHLPVLHGLNFKIHANKCHMVMHNVSYLASKM